MTAWRLYDRAERDLVIWPDPLTVESDAALAGALRQLAAATSRVIDVELPDSFLTVGIGGPVGYP